MEKSQEQVKDAFDFARMRELPISSIVGGWKLQVGGLYLLVRCPDGVIRQVIIQEETKK